MIVSYPPEGHGPPLTNGGGILQRQSMRMTGNLQFDPPCRLQMPQRSLALLPLLVTIMQAKGPTCEITVVGVLLAVLRGNRMRLEDLTDSEVSTEWTWTGTMIEYLGIHT